MQSIPHGYCNCGCGQKIKTAPKTSARSGHIKGEPFKYLVGHTQRRSPVAYEVEDHGYATPCWIWQRSRVSTGYGMLRRDGKGILAHRAYYEAARGPIPPGHQVHHLCGNQPCVNPNHLEALSVSSHASKNRNGAKKRRKDKCPCCDGLGWI